MKRSQEADEGTLELAALPYGEDEDDAARRLEGGIQFLLVDRQRGPDALKAGHGRHGDRAQ